MCSPALDLLVLSDSGASSTDNITSDNTPDFVNSYPVGAGQSVDIIVNNQVVETIIADANGYVNYSSPALADGTFTFAEQLHGYSASPAVTVIVDTMAPTAAISSAALTNDTTPIVSGTADAGATVIAVIAGATYSTVATAGAWSIDTASAVPTSGNLAINANGSNSVSVTATDVAGNTSAAQTQALVVDTTAPTVAVAIIDASLTNSDRSSAVTFTFSEAPTDFAVGDIATTGGTVSNLAVDQGNPLVYTATFTATPNFNGTGSVAVTDMSYTDLAGNGGTTGNDSVSIHSSRPVTPTPTPPILEEPTAGPDTLTGTSGTDNISGGLGADTVGGGLGDDTLFGNQGSDTLFGNQGADTLYGGQDNDSVLGGQNDDNVQGNLGDDTVEGNKGNDVVLGNQGSDTVLGNESDDFVHGGQGDDFVHGGQGNDSVFGGFGNDTLNGGVGDNRLTGGDGADVFVFGIGGGSNVVTDFNHSAGDALDLQGQTYTLTSASDGSAVLDLSGGGTITLTGMLISDFEAAFVA